MHGHPTQERCNKTPSASMHVGKTQMNECDKRSKNKQSAKLLESRNTQRKIESKVQ